jgi:hypothetical protein
VKYQVRRAIMVQLYTHASFSLPCLGLLAISWSLLFHDYLPASESLGWLGLVLLLLLGRWWHLRWRQPRLAQLPLPVLERELFVGVTITSIIWALGVLLYMDKLPDTYRAAMMMLSSLILTGSAIMLFGSRRTSMGRAAPRVCHVVRAQWRQQQERIVSCMLAGYLFVFLPTLLRRLRRDQVASLYHSFSNADLVAELKAVSEHLKLTSRLDGLTGIANRAHLDDSRRAWRAVTVPGRRCLWCWWMWTTSSNSTITMAISWGTSACSRWRACWPKCCGGKTISPPVTAERVRPAAALHHLAGGHADRRAGAGGCEALGIPHHKSRVSGAGQLQLRGGDPGAGSASLHCRAYPESGCGLYQAKHNGRDRIEVALMGKVA